MSMFCVCVRGGCVRVVCVRARACSRVRGCFILNVWKPLKIFLIWHIGTSILIFNQDFSVNYIYLANAVWSRWLLCHKMIYVQNNSTSRFSCSSYLTYHNAKWPWRHVKFSSQFANDFELCCQLTDVCLWQYKMLCWVLVFLLLT